MTLSVRSIPCNSNGSAVGANGFSFYKSIRTASRARRPYVRVFLRASTSCLSTVTIPMRASDKISLPSLIFSGLAVCSCSMTSSRTTEPAFGSQPMRTSAGYRDSGESCGMFSPRPSAPRELVYDRDQDGLGIGVLMCPYVPSPVATLSRSTYSSFRRHPRSRAGTPVRDGQVGTESHDEQQSACADTVSPVGVIPDPSHSNSRLRAFPSLHRPAPQAGETGSLLHGARVGVNYRVHRYTAVVERCKVPVDQHR